MADKEVLEMEVKSNIKGIAKDQKEWNKELKKTKENIEDVVKYFNTNVLNSNPPSPVAPGIGVPHGPFLSVGFLAKK